MLTKLLYYLAEQANVDCKGPATALVPMCTDMWRKLKQGLDDPTWVWQMAFLALMDPSGECNTTCEYTCAKQ